MRELGSGERGAEEFCALIENVRLLKNVCVRLVPEAEAALDQAVGAALRVIEAVWEGAECQF